MPSTGWSPISRTDSILTGARGRGQPDQDIIDPGAGLPRVAATYGLRRSQVQPGDRGRHTARHPQEPGRAPSARSCVTRDAGCYGAAGAGRADG